MKSIISVCLVVLLIGCTTIKGTQQQINSGDYSSAIHNSINKIAKDKYSKKAKAYSDLLYEAYHKHQNQLLDRVSFLKQDNAFNNAEKIFSAYKTLRANQQKIKPLLPLEGTKGNLTFDFVEVNSKLIKAKSTYADALFNSAINLLETQQILDSRTAYNQLQKVKNLEPDYPNLDETIDIAYNNGLSFVYMNLKNSTQMVLPKAFQESLLSLNTYNLNDFWTVYHNSKLPNVTYDREVIVDFQQFNYSPERLLEREINLEREVVDGWEYRIDRKGDYVLDEDDNRIKEDRLVLVQAILLETIQSKEVEVLANVRFIDALNQQQVLSKPMRSVFVFENRFASYQGDIRALTKAERQLLQGQFVDYPSNELMLIDAANDIKLKLKSILKNNM
ncbi:hypothetical protein [Psychroflexus sp. ALD_RP9]|uniref:hypothetical protein n=1 Tax=Psychroflexus sp. ALD_RP9 TaxID=2777186 RepID=UPI001A8D1245|nr:hypothetical protein [Psychroflexus sp. ALD_RP9]QSS97336.1 hypothetical protein IMZ30_01055 [Psychroflexus sp. ALD_RP9]